MRTRTLARLAALWATPLAAVPAAAQELLTNGDAEAGSLAGWTTETSQIPAGDAILAAVERAPITLQTPHGGDFLFIFDNAPTGAPPDSMVQAALIQTGDWPAGATSAELAAWHANEGPPSCDPARVRLTFLDDAGEPLGVAYDSGWRLGPGWTRLHATAPAPASTARFRLELLGRLDCGVYIDTYFDDVSLVAIVCPADLDGDGVLTLFDFLAFQNLFDAGDPRADFDGDGALTIFDFLAFQNAFDAGCA